MTRLSNDLPVNERQPVDGPQRPTTVLDTVRYGLRKGAAPESAAEMGMFVDTSLCIGCHACHVACKAWNLVPAGDERFADRGGYDNVTRLGDRQWRHVKFVETERVSGRDNLPGGAWLMASDSCKHCSEAPCYEACPTGAIIHTEYGTKFIQPDICIGCGGCVTACPFGVIERSEVDGHAHRCELCYDRLRDDMTPACAKACPSGSISFGPIDELRSQAGARRDALAAQGVRASLFGDVALGRYAPLHQFFLLLGPPEEYGLPSEPHQPWTHYRGDLLRGLAAAAGAALLVLAVMWRLT